MKLKFAIPVLLAVLILVPVVVATPTGLTYMDSTWYSEDAREGSLVSINPNSTIIASVHDNDLVLFDTITLNKIGNFTFNKISAIEFSPDGQTLAVNKGSTIQTQESLKLIDIQNMTILEKSALADDRSDDLSWSPNGDELAAPGPDGNIEIYREADLSIKKTLYGVHNVDVSCIDYRPDGDYLVSGDVSGRYVIWNSDGTTQSDYREFGQELLDCRFTPDGNDLVLLGVNGKVMSRTFAGAENNVTEIDGATQITFSKTGTRMHVTTDSDDFRGLLTYDYTAFNEIKRTTFFHEVHDLAIIDDEFARLQTIFVAAGTGEVAVYLRQLIPYGFNQPGADLDGDSIPDDLDEDDDGDGIIDSWDDDIGCDAPDGTPCSRYPLLAKIRFVEIDVSDSFVIHDTFTLPTTYSSHIRNMSRSSIAADQVISSREAQLFADAMCSNIDQNDIIDQWRDSITLSVGKLGVGTVDCMLSSGMELIKIGDYSTQIALTISTTFTYEDPISLPLDITLKEQPLPTDGSIAWLAPAHPMAIIVTGDGAVKQEIPLWWNNEGDFAEIVLPVLVEPEPSTFENIISVGTHPLAFVAYIALIALFALVMIRRDNKIDFDLDEDEIPEELNPEKADEERVDEEPMEPVLHRKPSAEDSIPKKRKMHTNSTKKAAVSKTEDSNPNSGTKIKTKRKKIVGNTNDEQHVTKKKVVVPNESEVKTRKVRKAETKSQRPEPVDEFLSANDEVEVENSEVVAKRPEPVDEFLSAKEVDENQNTDEIIQRPVPVDDFLSSEKEQVEEEVIVEKKKKRKSVRRKGKSGGDSKLDEEKLQGNLVSDFLTED